MHVIGRPRTLFTRPIRPPLLLELTRVSFPVLLINATSALPVTLLELDAFVPPPNTIHLCLLIQLRKASAAL